MLGIESDNAGDDVGLEDDDDIMNPFKKESSLQMNIEPS